MKRSVLLELLATESSCSRSAADAWMPSIPLRWTVIERMVIPEALMPVVALSAMTMFSTMMFGRSRVMAPMCQTDGP